MLNGLSLFTGIGGIDVALSDWVRPIAYCEIDPYCQAVILNRQFDGLLPIAPIWEDINTLRVRGNGRNIDIIYGGFPCQGISVAGLGKGLADERSGLFYEIVRIADEIRPRFIFLENVPAITTRGGIEVVAEITKMGYDCRWITITASSVGALHKRERWFLLAHSQHKRCIKSKLEERSRLEKGISESGSINVAHSTSKSTNRYAERKKETYTLSRIGGNDGNTHSQPSEQTNTQSESEQTERGTWGRSTRQHWPFESREHWKETVSTICRVSDGIPFHVDQLRALGNSVVPQQVKEAFKILMGLV